MFRQVLKAGFLAPSRLPILHFQNNQHYRFCNQQKPGDSNEPHQPIKIKIGCRLTHPLQKNLKKELNQKFKISAQAEKHREKERKKFPDKGHTNSQKLNSLQQDLLSKGNKFLKFAGVFGLLFILLNLSNEEKKVQKRNASKDDILRQIKINHSVVKVIVERTFYENLSLTLVKEDGKFAKFAFDENQLPEFLSQLQQIRNGEVKVEFGFYSIPELSKVRKNLITILVFGMYGIIIGVMIYIFRDIRSQMGKGMQQLFQMQKFKPVKPDNINIMFKDVAGMHQAKFEVTEFVDFLKAPEKYIDMGAKVPKGALLTGPPGTGKTLLAKACAGEAGVPFFYVSGSDFIEKFSGLGASRVRSLFDEAEKNSPSIIFIDEIDAIGKKRDAGPFSNQERDNTLNQLLVRMDGFDTKNKVIVMAATNRKDMLDPALLRPGRFDRSVEIGIPNFEERKQILKVHLKKVTYDPNLTEEEIAKKIALITPGFSGAELANTCNQAAILAARDDLESITFEKFEKATQRVMAGLQKRNVFTQMEKQMLAYYQCGKAVISWYTEASDPIIKISILPFSKSSKGYSHSIRDETALNTMQELLDKVSCYLAGRASQNHFKGYVTTNGDKDLERAKKIITYIVTKFGMSETLNMIAFPDFDFTRKPYSQKTESLIDKQIKNITNLVQQKVERLIKEKEEQIVLLKDQLLKTQTLTHNQIKKILGQRPFQSNQNYQQYLQDQQENPAQGEQGPGSITAIK